MKGITFKWISVVIVAIIIVTIIVQGYTIRNHYLNSKKQYQAKIQSCLNNSIEKYYAEMAKTEIMSFNSLEEISIFSDEDSIDNKAIQKSFSLIQRFSDEEMIQEQFIGEEPQFKKVEDSLIKIHKIDDKDEKTGAIERITVLKGDKALDSLSGIKELARKIIISYKSDSLDFQKLSQLLDKELSSSGLKPNYKISQYKNDKLKDQSSASTGSSFSFKTKAASTYLAPNQSIILAYTNAPLSILKQGAVELTFSVIFVIIITAVLLFLYQVIKRQKALSEIKNDLINNITHEFKTPIATIATAIEGIQNFNEKNDPEKTKKYLQVSSDQLSKLNLMVEKLLETASLDHQELELKKEPVQIDKLIREQVAKYRSVSTNANINISIPDEPIYINADSFHFENVLSNLIDNAIKYGGQNINIDLKRNKNIELSVSDDGGPIPKDQGLKIFDQFYRVPSGNIHNVKGFGIGLYYSKKIIEQHGGRLELLNKGEFTIFKIILPWPQK